jgi:type I restriction enzyme S subunit
MRVDPESAGLERYVAGEHMDTDDLRIRRWGSVGAGYLGPAFTAHFLSGNVLYGSRRTYLRKVAVADFEGVCANTTFVLDSSTSELLAEFLPYVMTTERFHEHSIKQSKGSVNPYINFRDLTWYEFALPPIDEQRRIVEILQQLDQVAEADRFAAQSASKLVESIIECRFQSLGTQELPALREVCLRITDGPFGSKLKTEHYRDSGARVIRLQNIEAFNFIDEDRAFISLNYYNELSMSNGMSNGDLVVAGLGDDAHVLGRAAIVPKQVLPAVNKADCFLVRPGSLVTSEYLEVVLNSKSVLKQVAALGRGTTRLRVSSGAYRDVKIAVPSSEVQAALVQETKAARAVEESARRAAKATADLGRLLLNGLLRGEDLAHVH